jgi:hypothetical protein
MHRADDDHEGAPEAKKQDAHGPVARLTAAFSQRETGFLVGLLAGTLEDFAKRGTKDRPVPVLVLAACVDYGNPGTCKGRAVWLALHKRTNTPALAATTFDRIVASLSDTAGCLVHTYVVRAGVPSAEQHKFTNGHYDGEDKHLGVQVWRDDRFHEPLQLSALMHGHADVAITQVTYAGLNRMRYPSEAGKMGPVFVAPPAQQQN